MDAPKCRICDKRHWGLCSQPRGRKADPVQPVPAENALASKQAGVAAGETAPNRQLTIEELGGPFVGIIARETAQLHVPPDEKPKFDRNAYQREYMRKRRAALKGGDQPR